MAKETKIEWATATWNPWIGCTKVSPACDHCYAESWAKRCGRDFNKVTRAADATFNAPLKWQEPRRIFVCSLSDFFHSEADLCMRADAVDIIKRCPQHTFMLLTKRPENIMKQWPGISKQKNIWLGATVENQEQADKRIPLLLQTPAAVRFISVEPMLGPVDLKRYLLPQVYHGAREAGDTYQPICSLRGLDWVICGGESGGQARPMHPDWARSLRDQCKAAGAAFFLKQMAKREPIPQDLLIKEMPHV